MIIFTDGSTINNGKKNAIGGIGVYIPKQETIEEWSLSYSLLSTTNMQGYSIKVTNQISELIAIILGIEKAIELIKNTTDTIYVYTDSKYAIECATSWCKSWIKNNWKKSTGKVIDNLWLIYRLVQLTKLHPIIFKHVRSHQEEPTNNINSEEYKIWFGNNKADKLAQIGSRNVTELNPSTRILKWQTLASLLVIGMKKDMNNNVLGNLPFIDDIKDFYNKMFNIDTTNN
jgi:ribonuclease HI